MQKLTCVETKVRLYCSYILNLHGFNRLVLFPIITEDLKQRQLDNYRYISVTTLKVNSIPNLKRQKKYFGHWSYCLPEADS